MHLLQRAPVAAVAFWALAQQPCAAQQGPPSNPQPGAASAAAAAATSPLIIDQQRVDRTPVTPSTSRPALPAPAVDVAGAPKASVAISRVRFTGSTVPAGLLQSATRPFIGKPVDTATLQAMANAVSAAYGKSNIALYTVQIPVQAFDKGVVTVAITEGLIGQVGITGKVHGERLTLLKEYANKLASERPLTRRTFERYLSLIRDIPGLTVTPALTPTKLPGVSLLTLDIKQRRNRTEVSFGDQGTPRLGRVQVQAVETYNGLLRQGDQTQINVAIPTDIKPFQYVSITHSTPIGTDGLRAGASLGYLRTRPKDSPVKGDTVTAGLNMTYPLIRGFQKNLYVTAALDGQNSDNAAFGQLISSDHTRAGRVGLSWTDATARVYTAASATGSLGLNILGARTDDRLTDGDFKKLNIDLAHNHALGKEWVVRLRGTAQLSDGRLPAIEQLALGGDAYGRAFPSATIVGDQGEAAYGELTWASKAIWPKALAGSELYGFGDTGRAKSRERFGGLIPAATYHMTSAGAGVRLNIKNRTVINIEAADAIDNPLKGQAWRLVFGWRSLF